MSEEWRVVSSHPAYEVSNLGRVRSVDRDFQDRTGRKQRRVGKLLKPDVREDGHLQVCLSANSARSSRKIHRLVAEAFIGPGELGMEVCHNNGDPADNRASNLRWDTRSANVLDEVRAGRHHKTRVTHCPRGHALAGPNLEPYKKALGHRGCLACYRAYQSAYRSRRKGEAVTPERFQEMSDARYQALFTTTEGSAA